MSKFTCKYCGLGPAIYKQVGPHVGEWCHMCRRWIRWVPKREINVEANAVEKEITSNAKTVDDIIKETARQNYEEGLDEEVPW